MTAKTIRVNGISLGPRKEDASLDLLREQVFTELLRQEAARSGWVGRGANETVDDVRSGIEAFLDRAIQVQPPQDDECRRYYQAHPTKFFVGQSAEFAHILFAVTAGTDVAALRAVAEKTLADILGAKIAFAEAASKFSNCPSGASGGVLGRLTPEDLVPELRRALFSDANFSQHTGVLPRLVQSRFGFHIIEIRVRMTGRQADFEEVQPRIQSMLALQARANAIHRYVRELAQQAKIVGVELDELAPPLAQ